MLPRFELCQPRTLPEALGLLSEANGSLRPFAGGTNLIPDLRSGRDRGGKFMALAKLDDLRFIRSADGCVEIGGRTTVNDLLHSSDIERDAPALHASARAFAGHMVRNAATVAGNICYGSPSADLLPPLLSLDADVMLAGAAGTRTTPLASFNLGYKKTALKPGELVTKLSWPHPKAGMVQLFYKLGLRKGDAISVANAAVTMALQDRVCRHVRIAMGSVAATVVRAEAAEKLLLGRELNDCLISEAADLAAAASSPIDDLRASREYRLHVTRVVVKRLLCQAMGG
ncbi:MAG TPA: FAD binding domain-containing protein [Stellaceae bacterium]|nr:FAD binding domain-containing protein [Stellaceae bacterium]